jgi:drug/metabolite transporter, DME family
MFLGYSLILLAASFWGGSAVLAKHLLRGASADALLLSQARVTFAWLLLLVMLAVRRRDALRVRVGDLWHFVLLGVVGVAGANFFLYFAVGKMDTAVADLIQFTAPLMVALWMWQRGFETMDRSKIAALTLSLVGSALALGVLEGGRTLNAIGAASAIASAFCYAFLIVWGKHLSRRYSMATYLHYALLGASLFWACLTPPWRFVAVIGNGRTLLLLVGFAVTSVFIPYQCFFAGLKRVPASRAAIVSTWEPVFVTICAWAFLGENLSILQVCGIVLVLAAIATIETVRG